MSEPADGIRTYIADKVAWDGEPGDLTVETALFDEGVLDSMAVVDLIAFLEGEYGVEIDEDDIVLANFASIHSIARLVDEKKAPDRA